nr:four-carbon acid sugar kinase family protein [uncultured Cohaesibacter sp.]
MQPQSNPETSSSQPWVTWYGDDFTGAAAVMEVLAFAGVPTILFTEIPSDDLKKRFSGTRAVGLASTARSKSPQWMRDNLPGALSWLDSFNAPILHYKVCSTFDSSPQSGSIGTAIETALTVRPSRGVPMITAAPQMRRYQAFGHLYAGTFEGVFRLDRHPVMARHPVTPMNESDLLRHLAAQTDLPSGLIDVEALWSDPQAALDKALAKGAKILSIDSMEATSEEAAGRLLWTNREDLSFVVGSQGVEYALVRHWLATGLLSACPPTPSLQPVDRIVAVSGSVSPMTAEQLCNAEADGFVLIPINVELACGSDEGLRGEIDRLVRLSLETLERGASPLVCSARGPEDPAVETFHRALSQSGMDIATANERIGVSLGRVLDGVLSGSSVRRAVISGGDTSGYGLQQLGIQALEAKAATIPGASICVGYGQTPHDGLEIALKGGQMGTKDFFSWIRRGGGSH